MKATQLTSLFLFILLIFSIHKIIGLKQENAILKDNTKKESKTLTSEINNLSERLTTYYLITLEQNKGLELSRTTKNWKANNTKLNNLMQKL